jgi:hypothetical protein
VNAHQTVAGGAPALRRAGAWTFALAGLALAGCGGPPRGEVEGVVTRDGKPLPNVEVVFLPDPELGSKGPRAAALTDKDGRYHLRGDKGQEGAAVGRYRVLLVDNAARKRFGAPGVRPPGAGADGAAARGVKAPQPQAEKQESRVPARYASATATPLRGVEVKPGTNRHDFKVGEDEKGS